MQGPLKKNLRCWLKNTPYDLQEGVNISSEWNEQLQWWNISLQNGEENIQLVTTDQPEL